MTWETRYDEERLGQLLALLPPAPEGWVEAAQVLPAGRRRIDDIVSRAEADAAYRKAVLTNLEAALADAGCVPAPPLVEALRRRFSSS
jgi:hypothetical protein